MYAKLDELRKHMDFAKFDELTKEKCTNMATALLDKYNDETKATNIVMDWQKTKFTGAINELAKSRGVKTDDLTQETLAGLVELSTIMLQLPRAMAIGRDLVRIEPMMKASRRVRIRAHGKAGRSVRGMTAAARKKAVNSFITIEANSEIEQGAEWDNNAIEDIEYPAIQEDVGDAVSDVMDLETEIIVKFINSIPTGNLATGARIDNKDNGIFSYDDMLAGWEALASTNYMGDTMAMNTRHLKTIMADQRFIDDRLLGRFVDVQNGRFGRSILGFDILVSNHIPKDRVIFMQKKYPVIMALRRDRMMSPYDEVQQGKHYYGVGVSTRYDLYEAVPQGLAMMDVKGF